MPPLHLPDVVKETFVNKFRFRPTWIHEAITQHDKIEIIQHDNLENRLYAKKIGGKKPSWFVVLTDPNANIIEAAFRLYYDFEENLNECTPLGLIQAVTKRFGHDLTIGSVKARFFVTRDVPLKNADPTKVIVVPKQGTGYVSANLRISRGPPPFVSCALVFSVDIPAYRAYLNRWNR
jgi:hypothetical protein